MEVSGRTSPSALLLGEGKSCLLNRRLVGTDSRTGLLKRKKKSVAPVGIQTPYLPRSSLVTVPTNVVAFRRCKYEIILLSNRRWDSSVGIETCYRLYCPGIEFRFEGEGDFPQPSRPALRPTQPPVQCVSGLSRG